MKRKYINQLVLFFLIFSMSFSILIKEDVYAIQFQTPNIIDNAPPKISSLSNDKWTLMTKNVGDLPRSVIVGDANNDGQNDIVMVNMEGTSISILLWNITSMDWNVPIIKVARDGVCDVVIEDANNDGQNDIVTSNLSDESVSIFLWDPILNDWLPSIRVKVEGPPHGVSIADANNDGQNEIITPNGGTNNVSILLWNTTSRTWNKIVTRMIVGMSPWSVDVGDVNNDGYNDIITADIYYKVISILLWNINPPPTEESGGPFPIPGYNIIFLLSSIGVILIIIINKSLKDRKPLDNKP